MILGLCVEQSGSGPEIRDDAMNKLGPMGCRYGGQFAYVEIINSMTTPSRFTSAVALSTPIMSVAYLSLGMIGYWSRGRGVQEIIIFGTGMDVWSRIAAGAILFQVHVTACKQKRISGFNEPLQNGSVSCWEFCACTAHESANDDEHVQYRVSSFCCS